MEITEHERVLLVNSLIQTISELYEHDGDNDRAALGALLARMTAAYQGPVRRVREAASAGPPGSARDDRLRADRSLLAPRAGEPSALVPAGAPPPGRASGVPPRTRWPRARPGRPPRCGGCRRASPRWRGR